MPSKDGWVNERDHDKITLGKKQYRNMEEWSRPCSVCGEKFAIFVRGNTNSVNASFGLRTCKEHRGQKTGAPGVVVSSEAVDALKKELAEAYDANMETMKTLGGLRRFANEAFGLSLIGDAINQESVMAAYSKVYGELQALKAVHELKPALEAIKNKMPWE